MDMNRDFGHPCWKPKADKCSDLFARAAGVSYWDNFVLRLSLVLKLIQVSADGLPALHFYLCNVFASLIRGLLCMIAHKNGVLSSHRWGMAKDSVCAKGNLCGGCQRAGYDNQQILQASLCERVQMWRLLQWGESELHEHEYNLRVKNGKWAYLHAFPLPWLSKKGGERGCLVSEILLWKICLLCHNKQKNWLFYPCGVNAGMCNDILHSCRIITNVYICVEMENQTLRKWL